MMLARLGFVAGVLVALTVCAADDAKEADEGFRPLFNGSDLSGWEGADKDAAACWLVDGGDLVCTGKPGPWLRSVEQFGDFAIQLRMKIMTKPGEQFVIRRRAYAMIKKAFDANGIKFAFPTVQVAGGDSAPAAAQQALELTRPPTAAE